MLTDEGGTAGSASILPAVHWHRRPQTGEAAGAPRVGWRRLKRIALFKPAAPPMRGNCEVLGARTSRPRRAPPSAQTDTANR